MSEREKPGPGEEYCSNCGEVVRSDADTCPACGVDRSGAGSDPTFDVGTAFDEATERLTTQAGAVLFGLLFAATIISTVGQHSANQGMFQNQPGMEGMGQNQPGMEGMGQMEELFADMYPLALDISSGTASLLSLGGWILTLVVVILALDTFAANRDEFGFETESLGWKTVNLFIGTIAMVILVAIATPFLFIPGFIVAGLLFFFPAAIAIDGENFVSAFGTSVDLARNNVGGATVLLLITFVTLVVHGMFSFGSTSAAMTIGLELFRVAVWILVLAALGRAYATATEGAGGDPDVEDTEEEWTADDVGTA